MNVIDVDADSLTTILAAYRKNCRYLRSASVEVSSAGDGAVRASGAFRIEHSCFTTSTGHLDAVDFNICCGQLARVMFAECFRSGRLPAAADVDSDRSIQDRLPNILIVELSSSFRKPIDPAEFFGRIRLEEVRRVTVGDHAALLVRVYCAFADREYGFADGQVTLAFSSS